MEDRIAAINKVVIVPARGLPSETPGGIGAGAGVHLTHPIVNPDLRRATDAALAGASSNCA